MAVKNTTHNEQANQQAHFSIRRLYIKDSSFESPNSPNIFLKNEQPEVHMDLGTKNQVLADDSHEVVLTVTVNVKIKDQVAFVAEVQQAGIFTVQNLPAEQLAPMIGSFCPNILYPYAREAITDLVVKGGFPQLYLAPVNFDALYQQQQEQQGKKETEGTDDAE